MKLRRLIVVPAIAAIMMGAAGSVTPTATADACGVVYVKGIHFTDRHNHNFGKYWNNRYNYMQYKGVVKQSINQTVNIKVKGNNNTINVSLAGAISNKH